MYGNENAIVNTCQNLQLILVPQFYLEQIDFQETQENEHNIFFNSFNILLQPPLRVQSCAESSFPQFCSNLSPAMCLCGSTWGYILRY